MSRSGNVWDNAVMEIFFSTLKIERCHRQPYRTRDDAHADIFAFIERFYNLTRRHSSPGNQSPIDFERLQAVASLAVHWPRYSSERRHTALGLTTPLLRLAAKQRTTSSSLTASVSMLHGREMVLSNGGAKASAPVACTERGPRVAAHV